MMLSMGKVINSEIKSSKKKKTIVKDGKVAKPKKNEPDNDIIKQELCKITKKSKDKSVKPSQKALIAEASKQHKIQKRTPAEAEEVSQHHLDELMDRNVDLVDKKPNKKKKKLKNQQSEAGENQKDSTSAGNTSPSKATPNTPKLKKQNVNGNNTVNSPPKGDGQKKKTVKKPASNALADNKTPSEAITKQSKRENLTKVKTDPNMKELSAVSAARDKINGKDGNNVKQINSPDDSAKIFVGNLPTNINKKKLSRLFQKFLPINSIVIRTDLGKRCFSNKQRKNAESLIAYITFKDKATAEEALSMNGTEYNGRHLRVTHGNKAAFKIVSDSIKTTVFVGNLKYETNDESLRSIFSNCGEIDYVRCIKSAKGCIGVAYVRFKSANSVTLALELNGTMLNDRPIRVERYNPKKMKDAEQNSSKTDSHEKKEKTVASKKLSGSVKVNGLQPTSKKEKFKGVATKPMKIKKKKTNSQMLKLAKKIAPIPKTNV